MMKMKKKPTAREFFGLIKNWKTTTDEIKRDMKREWNK